MRYLHLFCCTSGYILTKYLMIICCRRSWSKSKQTLSCNSWHKSLVWHLWLFPRWVQQPWSEKNEILNIALNSNNKYLCPISKFTCCAFPSWSKSISVDKFSNLTYQTTASVILMVVVTIAFWVFKAFNNTVSKSYVGDTYQN